jgi:hypothetical protein
MKMGIFDDILGPLKDLIGSLTRPVKVIKKVLGEVVEFTEEIVESFEDMLATLRDLFNESHVETMFLSPFKDAAFTAISSIEKLLALAAKAGEPTTEGIEEILMAPILTSYTVMREALKLMGNAFESFITELNEKTISFPRGIHSEFSRVKSLIGSLPIEIKIVKSKIENEFRVKSNRAFAVLPDFPEVATTLGSNASGGVRSVGSRVAESFENIEHSIHQRLANENAVLDFFIIGIIILVIIVIASVFMITKSFIAIIAIIGIIVISLILLMVMEFLL